MVVLASTQLNKAKYGFRGYILAENIRRVIIKLRRPVRDGGGRRLNSTLRAPRFTGARRWLEKCSGVCVRAWG